MSLVLELSLIALVVVAIAVIATVAVYLIKVLINVEILVKSLNETTTIVNEELKPIMSELKITVEKLNSIASTADKQLTAIQKVVSTGVGLYSVFSGKLAKLGGDFLKGFGLAFNLFRRR